MIYFTTPSSEGKQSKICLLALPMPDGAIAERNLHLLWTCFFFFDFWIFCLWFSFCIFFLFLPSPPPSSFFLSLSPAVRVSFSQASSIQPASYSLGEDSTGPLRVCLQLVVGSLEIPVSVTVSTQNGTALGEDGRGKGGGEVRKRVSEGDKRREGRSMKWSGGRNVSVSVVHSKAHKNGQLE